MNHPQTILFCWEIGANYGHVNRFLPLAQQLRARGYRVVLALKDLSRVQALPGIDDFEVLQAPVWLNEVRGLPEPQVCYPDILQRFGYLDYHGLTGLLRAWRALFRRVKPDLMLADHAPTSLLASRGLDFPRALIGTGFLSPPRTVPLPSMRPLLQVPAHRLRDSEQAVLANVNRVLRGQGLDTLDNLAGLFDVDEDFLMTPQEFDHYPGRGPARYYGALLNLPQGSTPDWPDAAGPKLFAYLKPVQPHFASLVGQLRNSRFSVLAHVPGLSENQRQQLAAPNLHFSADPVNMSHACAHAQAVICNAGFGTVLHACLAGVPLLCLPMYVEQNLTARNVCRIGAGISVLNRPGDVDFAALLEQLVSKPAYRAAAQAFAGRYAQQDQQALLVTLAERCAELAGTGSVARG